MIKWTDRWKMVLKITKTHLLTLDPVTSFIKVHDLILKEKKAFRLLGVEVDKQGLFTKAQVRILAYKMAKKILALEKIVSSNIPIKTGLLLLLYRRLLASIGSYPTPHIQKDSGTFEIMDTSQSSVIRKLFGISQEVDDTSIRSEFGLVDTKTEASVQRLLLIHRATTNENDPLTPQLLNIPLDPRDEHSSEINRSQNLLQLLGSYMNINTFLKTPYETVKVHVCALETKSMCQRNKLISIKGNYRQQRFQRIKPQWGIENYFQEAPAHKIAAYLEAKTEVLNGVKKKEGCILCGSSIPSTRHLFIKCPRLETERLTFSTLMKKKTPITNEGFEKLSETQTQQKLDFLLGTAKPYSPFQEWMTLQQLVIDYSYVIKTKIQNETELKICNK